MNPTRFDIQRHRRGPYLAMLVALLALVTVALTQCRLVDHNVTGLNLRSESLDDHIDCMHRCDEQAKEARKIEERRHREALKECTRLDDGARTDCLKLEHQLHKRNQQEIQRAKRACKNSCYNEGGGAGGH
jgi:hypothetical protein